MKKITLIALWLMVCASLWGQSSHRDSVISYARHLKNIYRVDEAIDTLSTLVTPGQMDEGVMAELADCHFQNGSYENAAGTYFMLASLAPNNILYRIRQMQLHYRMKSYPQSIQAGRSVLALDSIPAVMSLMGDIFKLMEEPDSALWYYRRFLAYKPENVTVVAKAANLLISKGEYDEALSLTGTILDKDPDNTVIAPVKGLALYRKGDYEAAVDLFQRQRDIGNESYSTLYYLGQSYWHTQVIYEAEEALVAAWQIDSSDVNLAYSIASVKGEAYRSFEKEVKPWLDKVGEMLRPDPSMVSRLHQQYGLSYYRMEMWDKAIEHYKEAYRFNPKFISALATIAYCYEVRKDFKSALLWYEKYLKVAPPGSQGYIFAEKSVEYIKGELFMDGEMK